MKEEKPYIIEEKLIKETIHKYNPAYGDNRICKCGHPYYRHFDTYEDMEACGCKYCACDSFVEKLVQKPFFCKNQVNDDGSGNILCIAHVAEGRIFTCAYDSAEEAKTAEYKCQDIEEISQGIKPIIKINTRWEQGIPHDPRSQKLFDFLKEYDFKFCGDYFQWKSGGDGDNGEALLYELDEYFASIDAGVL